MSHSVDHANVPLVSVVILNYNGLRFLEQCVRSVLNSDYPNFEVVVVDNNSTDGSYELLCKSFGTIPNLRIVCNSKNVGFAQGNNVGYAKSKGEVIVFLNVDIIVERTWLSELVRALVSDDKVGGAQSRLAVFGMDRLGFIYMQGGGSPSLSAEQVREPFYPNGASMAFKRSVLEEVALDGQPFDRDYFLYFEDNDLGWRVRLRGYKILFVPMSVVHHYVGGSSSSTYLYVRTFSFAKNRLMTLLKNYDLANLVRFLPLVVLLEIVRVAPPLSEEPVTSIAKLRALLWCLTNFKGIWRKRLIVQSRMRTVPDSEITRYMLKPNFSLLMRTLGRPPPLS